MRAVKVIVHADDFGITREQSERILACSSACGGRGPLNSTSIMVGSPAFDGCAELVRGPVEAGRLALRLHLNLVEGPCCADPAEVPLLVSADGLFRHSFAALMAATAAPGGAELRRQIGVETQAQMQRFLEAFPGQRDRLQLDSHQHTHAIPAVMDAVLGSARACGATLGFVRTPAEPLGPYLAVPEVRRRIPPVNLVKNALLRTLWQRTGCLLAVATHPPAAPRDDRQLATAPSTTHPPAASDDGPLPATALFFGVALSGCMHHAAEPELLRRMAQLARQQGADLELLFHPGGLTTADDCLAPHQKGFVAFHLSSDRTREQEALQFLPVRCTF